MIEKVYAPNLHLFVFHLCKVLRDDGNNRVENSQKIWNKCDQILENLYFSERLHLEQYNFEASENSKNLPIAGKLPNSEIPITGRVYAKRLHDSYALAFNLRRPEREKDKKTEDVSLNFFRELNQNNIFLPDFIDSSLGQTLLITAFIPENFKESSIKDLETLAQQCLEKLIPDEQKQKRPPLQNQGELFGSPIFEYDNLSQINIDSSDLHYCHILIWLFRENQSSENFIDCYPEFIDLFYYRNKVITAYQESLKQYKKAFNYYGEIEGEIKSLNEFLNHEITDESVLNETGLKFLKQKLKALSQQDFTYSQTIRNLKHHGNTITINSKNYQQTLKTIQRKLKEKSPINSDQKLDLFLAFINQDSQYFQERIKDELNYFVEGSTLVDRAIASIRGITEIEQTENQRRQEKQEQENNYQLQIKILAVGTGMSAGGITGSSSGLLLSQYATDYPVITFGISVIISFLVALFFYVGILGLAWIFKKKP